MRIMDVYRNEVIHLNRPLACAGCFPCCLQTMEISAPSGNVVGRIKQEWTFWKSLFSIENELGETVLRIKGPCLTSSCSGKDVEFKIVSLDEEEVGKISKKWSGLAREMFTDADVFGINFPMDLDVKMKAVMLGACFLIDFMYFESSTSSDVQKRCTICSLGKMCEKYHRKSFPRTIKLHDLYTSDSCQK